MCQISMTIPNAVLSNTNMNTEQATEFAKKMVALGYYTQNNVSIGYCAQIAGMTVEDFIKFLGSNKISIFQYDNKEELEKELRNA